MEQVSWLGLRDHGTSWLGLRDHGTGLLVGVKGLGGEEVRVRVGCEDGTLV